MPEQRPTSLQDIDERVAAMLMAANSSDVVQWEKLQARIEESPPGLSEEEHVKLFIDAVNGATLARTQWNQLAGILMVRVAGTKEPRPLALPLHVREALATNLQVLIDGSERDKTRLVRGAEQLARENVLLSPCSPSSDVRYRLVTTSVSGGLAYAQWLLVDPSRTYAKDLRRCRLSTCRRFFFKRKQSGAGAPSTRFCDPEHALEGEREIARERMRKTRGQ